MLALYLGLLDADFTIVDSPELVDTLRNLTKRYQRAIDASQQTSACSAHRSRHHQQHESPPESGQS
jgi:hypothetical protein